jgi:hypothetical protein
MVEATRNKETKSIGSGCNKRSLGRFLKIRETMILTKRDLKIFSRPQSYGLLRPSQLAAMAFPMVNLATVLRRLRKLEANGYIERVLRLDGYEIAWSVTMRGTHMVGGGAIKTNSRSDTLDHELKLTDLRLRLEGIYCG